MDSPTVIALTILGGVFLTMFAAILKSGVEGAIKMWGVMGAVTGVAIGAITSYYFADQAFQTEIQVAQDNYKGAVNELNQVTLLAGEYRVKLDEIESSLSTVERISPADRARLTREIRETGSGLQSIENRTFKIVPQLRIETVQ